MMNNETIICLGDSLTEGYGFDQKFSWPSLLEEMLKTKVINKGISGDTSGGMLSRFDRDVIIQHPSHLIIMSGTNDLWFNLPNEQILSNYHAMIRHAQSCDITCVIGIPTSVHYHNTKDTDDQRLYSSLEDLSNRVTSFQSILSLYASDQSLPTIEFYKNLDEQHFLKDGIHPNKAGYEIMAKHAFSTMHSILTDKLDGAN